MLSGSGRQSWETVISAAIADHKITGIDEYFP